MFSFVLMCIYADEPVVVSVLDGATIKTLLEDEDDFAMLAESLFEELDTDESGKLSSKELRPAILQLGVEQGVPPAAGVLALFDLNFVSKGYNLPNWLMQMCIFGCCFFHSWQSTKCLSIESVEVPARCLFSAFFRISM